MKRADSELMRQIRCFPYEERSDIPRLQQVEQKAVGRQRKLGLRDVVYTKREILLSPKCTSSSYKQIQE
jgi:hypothetical protein